MFKIPDVADVLSGQEATARWFSVDMDAVVAGISGSGVISGFGLSKTASSMLLTVAAGVYSHNGKALNSAGGGYSPTPDATNPRIGIIYIDTSTGAVGTSTGTAAAAPQPPTLAAGQVELHRVLIEPAITNWDAIDIAQFDRRVTLVTPVDRDVRYVDTVNGHANANGLTWASAYASINTAVADLTSGGRIYLLGEHSTPATLTQAGIEIVGVSPALSVIKANNWWINAGSFTLRNLTLDQNGLDTSVVVIGVTSFIDDVLVEGCVVTNRGSVPASGGSGAIAFGAQGASNVVVRRNLFTATAGPGISILQSGAGRSTAVVDNVFVDCHKYSGGSAGWIVLNYYAPNMLVANNVLMALGTSGAASPFSMSSSGSTANNEVALVNNVVFDPNDVFTSWEIGAVSTLTDTWLAVNNLYVAGAARANLFPDLDPSCSEIITATRTLDWRDGDLVANVTGGSITLSLPDAAAYKGKRLFIQRWGASNTLTLNKLVGANTLYDESGTARTSCTVDDHLGAIGVRSTGDAWYTVDVKGAVTWS